MARETKTTMKLSELLTDETRWTKRHYARDKFGLPTFFDAENAVCWCLYGAVRKITDHNLAEQSALILSLEKSIDKLYPYTFYNSFIGFNDNSKTTFEMVKRVIDDVESKNPEPLP